MIPQQGDFLMLGYCETMWVELFESLCEVTRQRASEWLGNALRNLWYLDSISNKLWGISKESL